MKIKIETLCLNQMTAESKIHIKPVMTTTQIMVLSIWQLSRHTKVKLQIPKWNK